MSTSTGNHLRAVYTSPQPSTQTFQHDLSSTPVPSDTSSKVAYLGELRQLVPKLQDEINVFLTERMEEDKKAAEAQGRKESEKEAKEEENYGEENVEEDA
ncbi:uncharacterized protein ACHE_60985A [Aspergillus chevalieri]|uniref:EKC/KEOPS complex subunit GON7 n=1 Tax=Aspergillus chevalieri TaxID=182096 RepID=A0A7R7ZRW6_ASPCH|nr:uncharacterized protein ACHE_60985A [Aspergillus chevalieri]BCR91099.1 hypothetical protein ACHE_60985A [Aspergillus chevalieri]